MYFFAAGIAFDTLMKLVGKTQANEWLIDGWWLGKEEEEMKKTERLLLIYQLIWPFYKSMNRMDLEHNHAEWISGFGKLQEYKKEKY